jgi:DNA-binding LacI/PurR family transcriptional regulator
VAYIGPDDKRVAGYQQALWEHGISPQESLVSAATDPSAGYARCEALLDTAVTIDAICAGCDDVGIGVLNCLHQHDLSVPAEVAVASIDNIDVSAYTVPALTTVDVPKHEMGRHAINILTSDRAWQASSGFVITVPTQLIVRETSVVHEHNSLKS